MQTLTIPDKKTRQWQVSNRGELLGNLWMTKNIDLESSRGKLRLAERIKILYDNSDDASFDQTPKAFIRTNADGTDRWWTMTRTSSDTAHSAMYKTTNTDPLVGWTTDTLLGYPLTANFSMDTFLRVSGYDRLIVPNTLGDLAMLNNQNVATINIASSTNANPTEITTATVHGLGTGDQVTIAGHTTNTNANGTYRITYVSTTKFTLDARAGNGTGGADGTVTTGKWLNRWWTKTLLQTALSTSYDVVVKRFDKIFLVGNGNFLHTIVESSDGTITSAQNVVYKRLVFPSEYAVHWIVTDANYAWIGLRNLINKDAVVARWNGSSEKYETPLPLYDPLTYAGIVDKSGVVHTVNGKGQLLAYNGLSFVEANVFPSFFDKRGWFSSRTDTSSFMIHRNGMTLVDGKIHILVKGDMGSSDKQTLENMPSGIWVNDKDIGLYCKYTIGQYRATNNDWGSRTIYKVGALVETLPEKGRFLIGAEIETDNGTPEGREQCIFYSMTDSSADNRGLMITSQIQASGTRDLFHSLRLFVEKLENSTDKIIAKIKLSDIPGRSYVDLTIAWVSTTQFTSTSDMSLAQIGDEIEFCVGKGAGTTAHISVITFATPTYTVTLDEAIPNVTGSGRARLNNYIKLGTLTNQIIKEKIMKILKKGSEMKIKLELRGTETSPTLDTIEVVKDPLNR